MKPSELQDHMSGTYFSLRWGMVAIAFAFPLVLWIGDMFVEGTGLQGSLSAYYHTGMRDLFVGLLVAIGACLYLYKGYSTSENVALNLAGIFVAGVALVPTEFNCGNACTPITTHRVVAVLFFLSIAYVAIFKGPDTLCLIADKDMRTKYRKTYWTLGTIMIVSPVVALLSSIVLEGPTGKKYVVVFAEWLAVWIFAAYWFFKSRELAHTAAEKRVLEKKIETEPAPSAEGRPAIRKVFSTQVVQPAA